MRTTLEDSRAGKFAIGRREVELPGVVDSAESVRTTARSAIIGRNSPGADAVVTVLIRAL